MGLELNWTLISLSWSRKVSFQLFPINWECWKERGEDLNKMSWPAFNLEITVLFWTCKWRLKKNLWKGLVFYYDTTGLVSWCTALPENLLWAINAILCNCAMCWRFKMEKLVWMTSLTFFKLRSGICRKFLSWVWITAEFKAEKWGGRCWACGCAISL